MTIDPADLTATAALQQIAAGRLSVTELREACISRALLREPLLRAMTTYDVSAIRAAHAVAGKLAGLPIGVKDVLDTVDYASEYGSPIWRGHRPRADAACVAWARASGAIVFGKTVTTEFATRLPGPTTNPHDLARTPGGSSSGSAAGVAAGYFPFAFGTQTAGSIIRPAAYCGIVGYKPTFGTIDRSGMKTMSESLDTIGVLARSVADCALLTEAVTGHSFGDVEAAPSRPLRIGLCRSPAWDRREPETDVLFEAVSTVARNAGAIVFDAELPNQFAPLEAAHAVVMNAQSARSLGWEMTTHRDRLSPTLRDRMEWGLEQPSAAIQAATRTIRRLQTAFDAFMQDLDVLLTPSAPGIAPAGLEWTGDPAFNLMWTALHLPCVTIPAGFGSAGMPLGIQIVAARDNDAGCLQAASWLANQLR